MQRRKEKSYPHGLLILYNMLMWCLVNKNVWIYNLVYNTVIFQITNLGGGGGGGGLFFGVSVLFTTQNLCTFLFSEIIEMNQT